MKRLFMPTINKILLNEILTLPADIRGKLIEKLIESLNIPIDEEIDKLWVDEVNNRVKGIRSREVLPIDGEEVMAAIRERLRK